jgi:glycosyltransferase involved in cell wall biosynthesis
MFSGVVKLVNIFSRYTGSALGVFVTTIKMTYQIKKFIIKKKVSGPVILDCQDFISAAAALYLNKKYHRNFKIVETVHCASSAIREMAINNHLDSASYILRFLTKMENKVHADADAVIYVNSYGREKAGFDRKNIKAFTIQPGLELPAENYSAEEKAKTLRQYFPNSSVKIACVSGLRPVKGIDLLLNSISILKKSGRNIGCIIVGDGKEKNRLIGLAKSLDILDIVVFTGDLSREEVAAILKGTDIYVQPSRDEAFCLAIIEAMASKCPVVAFRVGGIPEVVLNMKSGLLAEPEDVSDLAEKIDILIKDSTLRRLLGLKGYQLYKQKFSIARMIEAYEKFYKTLANQS